MFGRESFYLFLLGVLLINTPNQLILKQLEKEVEIRKKKELEEHFLTEHGEEYIKLKEAELALKKGLPHLYGFPWYTWARKFLESRNKMTFLCAANQISKSSTQIRKAIEWATNKDLWPELWPSAVPNQFVYFYPTANQASIEFETKWTLFLPSGEYKKDPKYGWEAEWKNKEIFAIHFNSGISLFFKSYKQGATALQTATAYAVFLDEECPEDLWDEICFRVAATNGYISMVFTATLGQELWRKTIEPGDSEEEKFPAACKIQVSMYDCQLYEDGTPSQWSNERINQVIASCKSPQEVQRRVFGKFVKDSGLKYPQFDIKRHMKPRHPVPPNWLVYVGVDIGAGGDDGHPSGICFVAVRPDYRQGRVIACWRGDGLRTTASDVYLKAEEMIQELKVQPIGKRYDWASVEFGEISNRNGGGWVRAEKSHELGEQVINVLFKNDMMAIYEDGESGKLAGELCSLTVEGPKRNKKDDLCDAFRYCVVTIPWDWSVITGVIVPTTKDNEPKLSQIQQQIVDRRKEMESGNAEEAERIEEEFADWNELYG